jgi:hypothetical protein
MMEGERWKAYDGRCAMEGGWWRVGDGRWVAKVRRKNEEEERGGRTRSGFINKRAECCELGGKKYPARFVTGRLVKVGEMLRE